MNQQNKYKSTKCEATLMNICDSIPIKKRRKNIFSIKQLKQTFICLEKKQNYFCLSPSTNPSFAC